MSRWAIRIFAILGVVTMALAAASGCGGPQGATPAYQDIAQANAQLEGNWRLVEFKPEQALAPTLQAMLEYQYQVMTVRIGKGRVVADAPGISFDRRYEVRDVVGNRFHMVTYDDGGVPYDSVCQFSLDGNTLYVDSQTAPWRGIGTLTRIQ